MKVINVLHQVMSASLHLFQMELKMMMSTYCGSKSQKDSSSLIWNGWFRKFCSVGAVTHNVKAMILTGFIAGACSMAIGEFVSVYAQRDVEVAQRKRVAKTGGRNEESEKEPLSNPVQAAAAPPLAFMFGAIVPLLAAALIANHKARFAVVVAAVTLAPVVFGWIGAFLGRTPVVRSCFRVLVGGWLAMAITFGLTKLIGSSGL